MAQPTSPFTQALSHLGRITLSSLPLDGALRLRDEINKLIDVNLRILSSNAQAENLSITNLINIAHIRERLQRLHVSVAQLDEILKRNIENLGRNLALDDSINDFERLMQLRDLSAYTVGFDCTTLEGLISRVVHELHATAERSTQVRLACLVPHGSEEYIDDESLHSPSTQPSKKGLSGLPQLQYTKSLKHLSNLQLITRILSARQRHPTKRAATHRLTSRILRMTRVTPMIRATTRSLC